MKEGEIENMAYSPNIFILVILEATQKKILWLGSTPEKCLYGNILMNSLFE